MCYICGGPFCLVPTAEGNLICLRCTKMLKEMQDQLDPQEKDLR